MGPRAISVNGCLKGVVGCRFTLGDSRDNLKKWDFALDWKLSGSKGHSVIEYIINPM